MKKENKQVFCVCLDGKPYAAYTDYTLAIETIEHTKKLMQLLQTKPRKKTKSRIEVFPLDVFSRSTSSG
jgi:hypothetical protein